LRYAWIQAQQKSFLTSKEENPALPYSEDFHVDEEEGERR